MMINPIRTLATLTLIAGGIALTGCAAVEDLLNRESTSRYDNRAAMEAAPAWIPSDATEIILRTPAGTDHGVAVVLVTSKSDLPESCEEGSRRSAPMLIIDNAPDVYKASTVMVCGDWSVIEAANGWYGWTPNDGDTPN